MLVECEVAWEHELDWLVFKKVQTHVSFFHITSLGFVPED